MLRILSKQIKEYKKPSVLSVVFAILEVIMEVAIPLLMASIIDKGITAGDLPHVYLYGGIMAVMVLLGLFFGVAAGKCAAAASTGYACNLRDAMYANIQRFSFSNIDRYSTAGLVTRMTTDVTNVQNAYQMMIRLCVRAPISLISALILAFLVNARISLIFVVAILFLGLCLGLIMFKTMGIFTQVFKKYDDLNASVQENVSAIRVVKAFVRETFENEKFTRAAQKVYKLFVKAEGLLAFNNPAMMLTVYGCILGISWMGAKMIVLGDLTTGQMTSLFSYVMNILISLMMLSMVFVMITMSVASARRIAEVLSEEPDITNPREPVYQVEDGSVDFQQVRFAYKKGSAKYVLEDIDLHVRPGETIGIIGGTGSAKSSLVNLISRLYDATEGCVKVGGRDVRDYDLDTLRNQVAVVLQKNVLFSGTILENLRWGAPEAAREECERACRLACADEFIREFPMGYETYLEQGGTNVSGGQKQRICIARALLKKPRILILDDSTSAVDTAIDARIRKAFREEIPGTTKFIIAQRISSLQDADRILVLDGGRIHGFGTHEILLESDAVYRSVYEGQMQGNGDFDQKGA